MAISLDPKQVISFEELLMSQVVQQEALTRLLIEKGIFTKKEFLEMVKAVGGRGEGRQRDSSNSFYRGSRRKGRWMFRLPLAREAV